MIISTEAAEGWPFKRGNIAKFIGVPISQLNNWLDRNQLSPEGRLSVQRGYYRLVDVFDLAGFAALRTANVPERRAAQYTRNYGFYRSFLGAGDQLASFSYRNAQWDVGVYDPSAVVSLVINMRSLGIGIFGRLAEELKPTESDEPSEAFAQFRNYYHRLIKLDRLPIGSAPAFEAVCR